MAASSMTMARPAACPAARASTSRAQRPPARVAVCRATSGGGQPEAPANVCRTCGVELSKVPAGCDGQGRQMGGLGAVPGFGWWPIKAYRPCPALNAAGIDYVRKGQTINETLFGGVSLGPSGVESLDEMRKTAEKGLDVK